MIKLCGAAGALMLWITPAAAQSNAALPADIQAAIRKDYVMPDAETRYLDGSIDLNADGKCGDDDGESAGGVAVRAVRQRRQVYRHRCRVLGTSG